MLAHRTPLGLAVGAGAAVVNRGGTVDARAGTVLSRDENQDFVDTIEAVDQRMRLSNGPAVFVKAWSATLGDSLLTDVGKRNAIGLGVVLFTRDPMALHTARRTAFHTSMASYARGCLHLGKQLERLGDLILTLKR